MAILSAPIKNAITAASVCASHLAEAPDVIDVEHQEPMLYLWQVELILSKLSEALT